MNNINIPNQNISLNNKTINKPTFKPSLLNVQKQIQRKVKKNKVFFNKLNEEKKEEKLKILENKVNSFIDKLIKNTKEKGSRYKNNIEQMLKNRFNEIGNNDDKIAKLYRKLFFALELYFPYDNFNKSIYNFYDTKVYGKKFGFIIPGYSLNAYKKNNDRNELIIPHFNNYKITFYENLDNSNKLEFTYLSSFFRKFGYDNLKFSNFLIYLSTCLCDFSLSSIFFL